MRLELNLLMRKPVKFLGIFEIVDVVSGLFGLIVSVLAYGLADFPLWLAILSGMAPVAAFFLKFRVGRRPGYFRHWVEAKVRARHWVSGFIQRGRLDDFAVRVPGWAPPRVQTPDDDRTAGSEFSGR